MTDLSRLYEEVHCLAYYYHWPASEILAFPRSKRRKFLELLRRQLERERGEKEER